MLDHLDGTLSANQEEALWLFLENNPDIGEEAAGLEEISLKETAVPKSFDNKTALKGLAVCDTGHPITVDNCQGWFIASVEGTLSPLHEDKLNAFLKDHPEMKGEYAQYCKTRLTPPDNIHYPNKRALKKFVLGPPMRRLVYYGAAAAVAILLTMVWHPAFFKAELPLEESFVSANRPAVTIANSPSLPSVRSNDNDIADQQPDTNEPRGIQVASNQSEMHDFHPSESKERNPVDVPPVIDKRGALPLKANSSHDLDLQYRAGYVPQPTPEKWQQRFFDNDVFMGIMQVENYQDLGFMAWRTIEDLTGVEREMDFENQRKNLLWTIADLGIAGVNAITGKQMELERQVNHDGRLAEYRLKTNRIQIKSAR